VRFVDGQLIGLGPNTISNCDANRTERGSAHWISRASSALLAFGFCKIEGYRKTVWSSVAPSSVATPIMNATAARSSPALHWLALHGGGMSSVGQVMARPTMTPFTRIAIRHGRFQMPNDRLAALGLPIEQESFHDGRPFTIAHHGTPVKELAVARRITALISVNPRARLLGGRFQLLWVEQSSSATCLLKHRLYHIAIVVESNGQHAV